MKKFTLKRIGVEGPAMLGLFMEDGGTFIKPALENAVTRIPPGSYYAKRDTTGDHEFFTLIGDNVHPNPNTGWAGRHACEMHPANVARQLRGCVALGQSFCFWDNDEMNLHGFGVLQSEAALFELLHHVSEEDFWLVIEETPPIA